MDAHLEEFKRLSAMKDDELVEEALKALLSMPMEQQLALMLYLDKKLRQMSETALFTKWANAHHEWKL